MIQLLRCRQRKTFAERFNTCFEYARLVRRSPMYEHVTTKSVNLLTDRNISFYTCRRRRRRLPNFCCSTPSSLVHFLFFVLWMCKEQIANNVYRCLRRISNHNRTERNAEQEVYTKIQMSLEWVGIDCSSIDLNWFSVCQRTFWIFLNILKSS